MRNRPVLSFLEDHFNQDPGRRKIKDRFGTGKLTKVSIRFHFSVYFIRERAMRIESKNLKTPKRL